jgi:hypothetical protein
MLTDFSGYLILVTAVVLTAMFLIWGTGSWDILAHHHLRQQYR